MLFYLVHELDSSLLAITDLEKLARSRQTREEQIKKDETVEIRTGSFDTFEEAYSYSALSIWIYLCITAFYAVFAKLVDLLLGPLQWKHVTALYAMITVSVAATRRRPVELIMMVATLSIMPGVISGSVTRLIGALFSLGAILWPFVLHTWENISDRTEVRWVLIGLLLDLVYLGTAKLISQVDKLGLKSIGLIIVVFAAECTIFCLGVHVIFVDGPWTRFVAIISPLSNFLQSLTRYIAQLLLFYLNRCARYILAATFTPRLPRIGTSEFLANLRNELHRTNFPNTSYGPGISSYAYQGLQGRDTIRLLLIRKGRPSQELECYFKVIQLGSSEAYEAVSYVWGDPSARHSILVDGRRLAITKSAYDIIHRRRSALIDQCIWIDRICINQGDMVEKASQVLMMGDIYKGAERVIAYLGDSENAHLVQLLFAELHFMKHGLGLSTAVMKASSSIWFQRPKWDALIEFFGNKWFRRVWIVQEAAFAQNLILFYGNICLDWEYVSRTADILIERTMIDTVQPNHGDPEGSGLAALVGVRNVDTMLEFHGDVNYRRKHDLARVLNECITFDSTDPRDKVFALLGLTTDNSHDHIKPNYSKEYTTQQVYTEAMRFILTNSDNPINILEWAGIGTRRSIPDLPSWVPDWSLTTPSPMEANRYNCRTRHRPKINLDMDAHLSISLNGIQFDRIKKLGPSHNGRSSYGMARKSAFLAKWLVEAEALATAQITETYNNGESRLEAFIRTIVGNNLKDESGESPRKEQFFDEYEAFKSFLDLMSSQELRAQIPNTLSERFLKQPFAILQAINRFSYYFQTATDHRAFCVTEYGRMAIVPPLCLPGDIICIIEGARTPFVLRNKESTSYSLIGCCYVHGVMEGEIDIQESHPFVLV